MYYVAIDPGLKQSAYIVADLYKPLESAIIDNRLMRWQLINSNITSGMPARLIIERPVCQKYAGSDVGETIRWTGIFQASWPEWEEVVLISRQKVKMRTVGKKATDAKIKAYLKERFANTPEWFKNFKADIWQAYALLVVYLDEIRGVKWN